MSFVAQSARGNAVPMVPQSEIDTAKSIVERMMIRWRGEPDPAHVKAVDAYFVSAAEHGMNASTFTGRVIASTGADVAAAISGAVGAMSGPLHGGAPSRVLGMIEGIEQSGENGFSLALPRWIGTASVVHLVQLAYCSCSDVNVRTEIRSQSQLWGTECRALACLICGNMVYAN